MKSRIGQNPDMNAFIISDTGIIRIINDSDSQQPVIKTGTEQKITPVFLDIIEEIKLQKVSMKNRFNSKK